MVDHPPTSPAHDQPSAAPGVLAASPPPPLPPPGMPLLAPLPPMMPGAPRPPWGPPFFPYHPHWGAMAQAATAHGFGHPAALPFGAPAMGIPVGIPMPLPPPMLPPPPQQRPWQLPLQLPEQHQDQRHQLPPPPLPPQHEPQQQPQLLGGGHIEEQLPADPWQQAGSAGVQAAAVRQAPAPAPPAPPPPPPPRAQSNGPASPPATAALAPAPVPAHAATHTRQLSKLRHAAAQRLQALFPKLPQELHANGWLLHRLVAAHAKMPPADLLSDAASPLSLQPHDAASALHWLAHAPAQQVAGAAAAALEELRGQYLGGSSGGEMLAPTARELVSGGGGGGQARLVAPAFKGPRAAEILASAALELVLEPHLAAPHLATGDGAGKQRRALPAPPPPAARGAIADVPPPLQALFAAGGGGGGSRLLRRLLRQAVEGLPASSALAAAPPAAGSLDRLQPPLGLHVSPDIDFGTVAVSHLTAEALAVSAASAAAGLPSGGGGGGGDGFSHSGGSRRASAGSILDLLHLAATPQQQLNKQQQRQRLQPQQHLAGSAEQPAGSSSSSSDSSGAAPVPATVLSFRQLVVENASSSEEVWLLGGVAAPSFPHTLAPVDDARLFWLEGHKAVRLGPSQQHTITVALSSADCAARRQESGVLQQLLLLVCAVAAGSRMAGVLAELDGVATADCPQEREPRAAAAAALKAPSQAAAGGSARTAMAAAAAEAAPAAATKAADGAAAAARAAAAAAAALPRPAAATTAPAPGAAPAPAFRLFVVARRVTVALVHRPADLATLLRVEARPYISQALRALFDSPPTSPHSLPSVDAAAYGLLATGRAGGLRAAPAVAMQARAQPGRVLADLQRGAPAPPPSPAAPLLQRHSRLLLLEEAAMAREVRRFDQHNCRLRLAVFAGGTTRYRLLDLAPGSGPASGERVGGGRGELYRGPALELLQPGGVAQAAGSPVYALAVLDVPGLPEGRPALLIGDAVFIRTAHQLEREIAALVAATDGSTVFLLLPRAFWSLADVAPLVPLLTSDASWIDVPTAFDGLVHVRLSFDRSPLRRMQQAIEAAAKQQVLPRAVWLPPPCEAARPSGPAAAASAQLHEHSSSGSGSSGGGSGEPAAAAAAAVPAEALHRLVQLQPAADVVAQAAAGLTEQGSQRLNAEQRQAVAAVVSGAGRAYPYALFGPPGTGKTVTLVETALQLLLAYPAATLLLCAPQNYSADLLCSALAAAGLGPDDLLRLNDPRRPPFTVKEDVLPFCRLDPATRMFRPPMLEDLAGRRVVVATCGAAGLLRAGPFFQSPCRFTHVLIDEAGQALLPEALIPLSLLPPPGGARGLDAAPAGYGAMLCGDPRQLSPIVRSQAAAAAGLATSLLELCINFQSAAAYEVLKAGRAPGTCMLVRNYRSHRRLLALPSKLFYSGSLVAAADPRSVLPPRWRELQPDAVCGWQEEEVVGAAAGIPGSGTEGEVEDAVPGAAAAATASEASAAAAAQGAEEAAAAGGAAAPAEAEEAAVAAAAAATADGAEWGAAEPQHGGEGGEKELEAAEEEEEEPAGASCLFYGVRGQQRREAEAPSWFNPIEASTVVELIAGLLGSGAGVRPDDIGVMATYRKQVQKIRLLLRQRGLGAIRVGTVDDYQGQEERIVFISTVLSRPESLPPARSAANGANGSGGSSAFGSSARGSGLVGGWAYGYGGGAEELADVHLSLWRNPKRFNVAITRAKALLVVVGHPAVLLEDASWRELLRHCFSQGAYRGAGADAIRQRFRIDVGAAAGALPELPAGDGGEPGAPAGPGDGEAELVRAIEQLAELALLGAGHAAEMFPETLDELYEASMAEAPFRVVL